MFEEAREGGVPCGDDRLLHEAMEAAPREGARRGVMVFDVLRRGVGSEVKGRGGFAACKRHGE